MRELLGLDSKGGSAWTPSMWSALAGALAELRGPVEFGYRRIRPGKSHFNLRLVQGAIASGNRRFVKKLFKEGAGNARSGHLEVAATARPLSALGRVRGCDAGHAFLVQTDGTAAAHARDGAAFAAAVDESLGWPVKPRSMRNLASSLVKKVAPGAGVAGRSLRREVDGLILAHFYSWRK